MSDNTRQNLIERARNYFTRENKFLLLASGLAIRGIKYFGLDDPQFIASSFHDLMDYISPYVRPLAPFLDILSNEVITSDNIAELQGGNKTPLLCSAFKSPFRMVSSFLPKKMRDTSNRIIDDIFSQENVGEAINGNFKPILNTIREKGKEIFGNVVETVEEKLKENLPKLLSNVFTGFFEKNKNYIPEPLQAPIEEASQSLLSADSINKPIEKVLDCVKGLVNNFVSKKLETLFPGPSRTGQKSETSKREQLNSSKRVQQVKSLTDALNEIDNTLPEVSRTTSESKRSQSTPSKPERKLDNNLGKVLSEINSAFSKKQEKTV